MVFVRERDQQQNLPRWDVIHCINEEGCSHGGALLMEGSELYLTDGGTLIHGRVEIIE